MKTQAERNSFLLVDGAQLAVAELPVPRLDDAPGWLAHVYDANAAAVSPMVVDIDAICCIDGADQMMDLANALQPQLHASLIDTAMSHEALTHHLRAFTTIRTAEGKAFTLRFADCTVLPILAAVFSPAQWTALAGPIVRWCVHDFDGTLRDLPPADMTQGPAPTPLVLSDKQLAVLHEAAAPTMMLAHLRDIGHGEIMPGSPLQQHRWASAARHAWRSAGNSDEIVLRWLTSAALSTHGQVLQQARLPALLGTADLAVVRADLLEAVSEHHARTQRVLNRETR